MEDALGVELPAHQLNGPEVDELRRALEHIGDLDHVIACCDELLAGRLGQQGPLVQALYESAVISYARCFNSGRRDKITERSISEVAGPSAVNFHRHIIAMRNRHVAHAVSDQSELRIGVIVTRPGDPWDVVGTGYLSARRVADDATGITQLRRLATLLRELNAQRVPELEAAVAAAGRAAGEDVVRSQPELGWTVPEITISSGPPHQN
ncbi:hypothetical protein [Curtobacterium sp. 'Ferrero']|uniref:hypothetical protein n=1 Tax=Curtobacterium sp. 'Ferrero' TaxID=2033654 RepID=UPI001142E23B|nr:hypothetical protein [Curtobacterium sp. 'Ferrero']